MTKKEAMVFADLVYKLRCNMTNITSYVRTDTADTKRMEKYNSLAQASVSRILELINSSVVKNVEAVAVKKTYFSKEGK